VPYVGPAAEPPRAVRRDWRRAACIAFFSCAASGAPLCRWHAQARGRVSLRVVSQTDGRAGIDTSAISQRGC